mmetsp:Transcript_52173/g.104513  ORF Transcript_52173/g.104513 Transcript_52173/m.104513 type:complete len:226 (-) Transcript_52173:110-787(-)
MSNTPSRRLSSKYSPSPSHRRIVTVVWLSREFAKHSVTEMPSGGMGVEAGMISDANDRARSLWLAVAMHNGRGTTSVMSTAREASIAAPTTMASSGLIRRHSSVPGNISCRMACTLGIRLEPPTSNTWSMSECSIPPCTLYSARSTGARIRSRTGLAMDSSSERFSDDSSEKSSTSSSTLMSDSTMRLSSTLSIAHPCASFLSALARFTPSSIAIMSTPCCCWKT